MKCCRFIFLAAIFLCATNPLFARKDAVILIGRCDVENIQSVEIVTYSNFWGEFSPSVLVEEQKQSDHRFILKFYMDHPKYASFMILGKTWHVYISPGDSLRFHIFKDSINQLHIHFRGFDAPYYNYEPEMRLFMEPYQYTTDYKNISEFKKSLNNWFDKRMKFLRKYEKKNNLSDYFKKFAQKEIQYEYVYRLYKPIHRGKMLREDLPEDYFKKEKIFRLAKGNYLHFSNYSMLAYTFKYIFGHSENIWNDFDTIYNQVINNFKGKTKSYLIANLIGVYTKKQLQNYHNSLIRAMNESSEYVDDSLCIKYINRCRDEYLILNRPFPNFVLDSTFLKPLRKNKKISLSKLLEKYKGKPIYVDFWASWCGACLEDISHSNVAKQILKKEGVIYLYISLDTESNKDKWVKKSNSYHITKDQYLLHADFSSPIVNFLNIYFIPRYLILDKDHNLISINAPRPTKYHLKELKKKIKIMTQKIVHY